MFFLDLERDYLAYIAHERRYSKRTVATYKWWLDHYARFCISSGCSTPLTVADAFAVPLLRRFQQSLSERKLKNRTVLAGFYGLRGLGDYCVEHKLLMVNTVRNLTMPKKGAAERTVVSDDELRKLLAACELQRDANRIAYERALLSTLIFTGVRAQELVDMRLEHINLDAKTFLVPHGKGDKSRLLHPPVEFFTAMRQWLASRSPCKHDWVWPQDTARRISVEAMRGELEEIKARAGLSHATWIKPHSVRHAFATRMMRNQASLLSISAALGHAHAQTTLLYLHHSEEPARDMHTAASLEPLHSTAPVDLRAVAVSASVTPLANAPAPTERSAPSSQAPRSRRSTAIMEKRQRGRFPGQGTL